MSAHERFERGRRARTEVERRVMAAIDRLDVALQFSEPSSGVVAQTLHAIHHLEQGWAGDSTRELVPEAPDFQFSRGDAEELVRLLTRLLEDARRAKYRVEQIA